MAIDTAAKRASALGVAAVFTTLILPDGAISQPDRQTIGNSYSGITAELPTVNTPPCYETFISVIDGDENAYQSVIDGNGIAAQSDITQFLALESQVEQFVALSSIIDANPVATDSEIDDSVTTATSNICK